MVDDRRSAAVVGRWRIFLLALVLISVVSTFTAPLGAKPAHRPPVATLKKNLRRRPDSAVGEMLPRCLPADQRANTGLRFSGRRRAS